MNAQKGIFIMRIKAVFRNAAASLLGAGALIVAGCGGEDTSSAPAPPVRGEPIQVAEVRGEPIEASVEQPAEIKAAVESGSAEPAEAAPEAAAASLVEKTMEAVKVAVAPAEAAVVAVSAEEQSASTAAEVAPASETVAGPVEGPALPPKPATESNTEASETTGAAKPAETAAAKPAATAKPEVIKSGGQEYSQVTFDQLASFEYEMPDEFSEVDAPSEDASEEAEPNETTEAPAAKTATEEKDQIPANVRKFNNTRVALEGFMLPLKVEDSLVTEMLIMRDQSMCCFGSVPKINEWVSIRMTGKGVKPVMDEPVTIYGKLKVGEIRENGYLVGIYEMDGDRMGARIDF